MSFEVIKTIKGHKYGYTVESYREDGKTKQRIIKYHGRIDKEPVISNALTIPYGFYYFTQDGCSSCDTKNAVEEELENIKRHSGGEIEIPNITYVNLSKGEPPINLPIFTTPTIYEITNKGIFVCGKNAIKEWVSWRVGGKRTEEIFNSMFEEGRQKRMLEIKEHIRNGKKYKELLKMGYDMEYVDICLSL